MRAFRAWKSPDTEEQLQMGFQVLSGQIQFFKKIICSWCKKGKIIPPPFFFFFKSISFRKLSLQIFSLCPFEMHVNPSEAQMRHLTLLQSKTVFLKYPGAISLKCNYQGRFCPYFPISAGMQEPNCPAPKFFFFFFTGSKFESYVLS